MITGATADKADGQKKGRGSGVVRGGLMLLGLAAVAGAVVAFNVMKRK